MIEISHLTKKYGAHVAVDDLSLTIEPGNIYGFLGPNGAGKSTTMNIITGYIGATSGEVKINGYDINKNPEEAKKCIGYLPELPPLYADMKVLEYLKFAAELKKIDKHQQTADIRQVLELTKLTDMQNRLIKNLSKGYRQRVGLAQALLGMPEIIILDEPTVGLDPKQIIEIRDLIKSLREKHTVVLSSHILQEISAVCDHVFIISKGKLVASDTMENLERRAGGSQQLSLTLRATKEQAESLEDVDGVEVCEIVNVRIPEDDEKLPENDLLSEEECAAEPPEDDCLSEEAHTAEPPEKTGLEMNELAEIQVSLTAKPETDIRESVYWHCVEHAMVLLEMKTDTKTLEDVFLTLTEEVRVS